MNREQLILNKNALSVLGQSGIGQWKGRCVVSYNLSGISVRSDWSKLFDRKSLREFCLIPDNSAEDCAIAILAWGGAKADHVRAFWNVKELWLPSIREIRSGSQERSKDYHRLSELRKNASMPGVGPAYFTKFLWFLRKKQDAYIMDQWTARSISILLPESSPIMDQRTRVSDRNTAEEYVKFCIALEQVAKELGVSSEECEAKMFSQGGRNPLPWRKYVRENNGKI